MWKVDSILYVLPSSQMWKVDSIEYEHHGLKAKEKHEKGTGTETRGPTEKIPIQVLRAREEGS